MFQRLDEGVLHELFGQANIAQPGGEPGPDPGALLAIRALQFVGLVHTRQSPSTTRSPLSVRCQTLQCRDNKFASKAEHQASAHKELSMTPEITPIHTTTYS
jgi:hypothetical protein